MRGELHGEALPGTRGLEDDVAVAQRRGISRRMTAGGVVGFMELV